MRFSPDKTILALTVTTLLAACGGSDNDKQVVVPVVPDEPQVVSIPGTVINNRLSNVKVCTDCNSNMSCDEDEVQAVSGTDGQFTLENVPEADALSCPLTAEVTEQSQDETLNAPVRRPYTMSSPAGCNLITPMTSMVQSFIELGDELDEAIAKIQRKMMTRIHPCDDDFLAIIENEQSTPEQVSDATHVYQMGVVYTEMMIRNMETLTAVTGDDDMSNSEGMAIIHNYQLNGDGMRIMASELAEIKRLTEEENNEQSASSATPQGVPANIVDIFRRSEERLKGTRLAMLYEGLRRIAENAFIRSENVKLMLAKASAQPLDFSNQFLNRNQRLNRFTLLADTNTDDDFELSYKVERINHSGGTGQDAKSRLISHKNTLDEERLNFGRLPGHDLGNSLVLVNDRWLPVGSQFEFSRASVTPYANRDQIKLTSVNVPAFSYNLEGKQYEISGRSIPALLEMHSDIQVWDKMYDILDLFPGNSLAFDLILRSAQNSYLLPDREDCNRDYLLRTVCNSATALVPKDDFFSIDSGRWHFSVDKADTFEDTESLMPEERGVPVMPILHTDKNGHIVARLDNDGSVAFIQFPLNLRQEFYRHRTNLEYNSETNVRNPFVLARGSWRERPQADGFVEIDIPNTIIRMNPELSPKMFFTETAGVMRFGKIVESGDVISEGKLRVNAPASDTILYLLDYDKLSDFINQRDL